MRPSSSLFVRICQFLGARHGLRIQMLTACIFCRGSIRIVARCVSRSAQTPCQCPSQSCTRHEWYPTTSSWHWLHQQLLSKWSPSPYPNVAAYVHGLFLPECSSRENLKKSLKIELMIDILEKNKPALH